jgi:hypothetical protein
MKTKSSVGNNDKKETTTPKHGSQGIRTLVEDLPFDNIQLAHRWSSVAYRLFLGSIMSLKEL